MENFNTVPDKGTFGGSVEVINQNFSFAQQETEMLRQAYNSLSQGKADETSLQAEITRATTVEENLRQLYNNQQQSKPIPVTELPATGEAGKIYRLAGTTSYADYMYNESDLTTPIKMAEYNNAIDEKPTPGSDNLVKGGGIFAVIKKERGESVINGSEEAFVIHDIVEEALNHVLGKWLLWTNGQENTNENYQYKVMKVRPQTSYIFPTNDNYNVCFYGANGEFVSGVAANRNKVITTPTNIFYMAVSYKLTDDVKIYEGSNGGLVFDNKILKSSVIVNPGSLSELINIGQNLFNSSSLLDGYYFNAQDLGVLYTNSTWSASPLYVPIKPSTQYSYTHTCHICIYDKDLNFISGIVNEANSFVTPANAACIRVSVETVFAPRLVISEGSSTPDEYVPFNAEFKKGKGFYCFNKTETDVASTINNLIEDIIVVRNNTPIDESDDTAALSIYKAIPFWGCNSNGFSNRVFGLQISFPGGNNRCSFATSMSYSKTERVVKLEYLNHSGNGYLINKYYDFFVIFKDLSILDTEFLYSAESHNSGVLIRQKDFSLGLLENIILPRLNSVKPYYVVSKNGDGDFSTVTDASASAPSGAVILIMPGIYDNEVITGCSTKKQYFIGIDKVHTIIKNHYADYNRCPFLIGAGMLKNLTVYAENTGTSATKPPYAVHSECHTLYNDKLLIENCDLISDYDAGIGIGLRGGCVVEIKNSTLKGINRGIYCHDSDYMQYNGRQQLSLINNTIVGTNSSYAIWIQSQGSDERTFDESQFYLELIGNRITSLSMENAQGYYHNFTNWYPDSGEVVPEDFGGAKNVRLLKTSWNNSDTFFNADL